MAFDFGVVTCLLNLSSPSDYVGCLNSSTGELLWSVVFASLVLIMVVGWSSTLSIPEGFMVGGFFSVLIGLGFLAVSAINIKLLMFPVVFLLLGLAFRGFNVFGGD